MNVNRVVLAVTMAAVLYVGISAQTRSASRAGDPALLKEWLSYLASDELQGREVYTEGLGLAASYIADRLKEWHVKPAAPGDTYFQAVKVLGLKANSHSTVTVEVNGRTRTFKDTEGIAFPRTSTMGGRQVVAGEDVQFIGYGLQMPASGVDDYGDLDPKGKVIVWLGATGPKGAGASFRVLAARSRVAVEKGALAVIAPPTGRGARGQQAAAAAVDPSDRTNPPAAAAPPAGRGGRGGETPDFTTAERYDRQVTPVVSAQDEFFEFLFSGSDTTYAQLKDLAAKQEPLPHFALKGVKLTFDVDPDYRVVSTRLSRNVVGIVEGSDPKLKDTYVAFGAHYDHIGYRQTSAGGFVGDFGCAGQTRPEVRPDDIVNNGADDDGSGTVALLALARAFATGPRPKRSLIFLWHTGEESGLQGSKYNADHPIVPNDRIVAQLNVDMVGRNRCDDAKEENTVYLVGSDRISTELHNISEDANASLSRPLTLDYELNDPGDPQSFYTRSDHFSYAAKGIPIIFYTTGLHRDYHYVTDEVERIDFPKLAHITELIYTTAQRLGNLDHVPVRDNKGPRTGRGRGGKIDASR